MRFNFRKLFVAGMTLVSTIVFFSCGEESGLGSSVDTESPKLTIEYPPSKAAINGSFVFAGTCSDDKGVTSVKVTVKNIDSGETVKEAEATVKDSLTWQITINEETDTGWELPDGNYEIFATAYDKAGRNSGFSSSRQFEIDNTPPVFVITKPGVTRSSFTSSKSYQKYGSLFTISGTIGDDHGSTVSSVDVTVYDKDGNPIETDSDSKPLVFIEEDVEISGGVNVTIAQATDGDESKKARYEKIYSVGSDYDDNGTKVYSCTITVADQTLEYKNTEDSGSGSGNSTSVVYFNSGDFYDKYLSSKKGYGLDVSDLKKVVNGTATDDTLSAKGVTVAEVQSALASAAVDTSDVINKSLMFSLNPNANPTYTISGFTLSYDDAGTALSSSTNKAMGEQPFTVIVSAGLDQTSIVPSSLKVWIKKIGSAAGDTLSKTELSESITSLAEDVAKKEAAGDTDFSTTAGWTLILDNSSDTSANDTTVSLPCEIPGENFVESDAYYAIVVTGQDQDDVALSQTKNYGFVGSISAVPPSVSITSPNNLAYYATSKSKYSDDSAVSENEALVFSGSAVENNSGMALKGLTAKITVTDESTSSVVAGAEVEVSLTGDSSHAWTTANGFTCAYDAATKKNNWTFTPSLCDSYEKIKAESAGLSRLYTFTITATGSGGLTTSDSRSIHIDTTRPTVTISSITPTVSGPEYFGESHDYKDYTFLNGSISIKGSVDESNLKEVTYDVRVSTNLTKALTADDSILAGLQSAGIGNIDGSLGRTFSISQTFDTSLITQFLIAKGTITKDEPVQAEIIVTAEDTVGNQGQYSSKEGNGGKNFIIYQETDRPKITLGNGDVTVTSEDDVNVNTNLFGTTNNNKLQLTFTDDDSVNSVFVTVYDEAGNKLDSSKISSDYGANPYSYSPKKSSYSLNYTLPGEEGVYQVRVDAYDENLITTDLSDSNSVYQNTVGKFFVAVDSGAPVIEVTSPADGSYEGETVNLKVTVTKNLEPTAELYRQEDSGSYTKVSDFATVADADGNKVTKVKEGEYTWIGKVTIPEITQGSGNRDGNYKIIVKAVDKYGQTSSKEREFKVDANPPEIGAPDTSDDNPVNLDTTSYVSITSVMEDSPAGIATARYFLSKTELTADELKSSFEAGAGWTQMNKGSANYNASVNVSAFNEGKDGTVYAYVAASDNAGNIGVNATPLKLELDEMAPAIVVKDFAGSGTVADKGTSTTNDSTKAFNVAVTDTNLKSLTRSDATVSVGTGSREENVTTYPVTVTWTELDTAEGKHEDEKTVTFTAEDEHGRKTSQTVTLKCDDYAPRVAVDAYADFATASLEIKGTVSDVNFSALGTKLKAYLVPSGSDIADSAKSGNVSFGSVTGTSYPWTAVFTGLDEGTYLLAIVAEDSFGNVSYFSVDPSKTTSITGSDNSLVEFLTGGNITVDTKAPDSTIELSGAGKVLDSSHAEVTASSSGKYSLTFGKIYYTNGTFTLGGDIDEGNLDLTDGKAPRLTVSKEGGSATPLSFTTGGRDAGAWTYVPNYAIDGSADGSYEYTLTLNDKAGQNFSKSVTVIVDTKAPTLLFTSPNKDDESFESDPSAKIAYSDDGSGINLSSVAYKVYDITGSTDGTEIESSNYSVSHGTATGSVTFNSTFTSEGLFKITAQVEDYLGHKSELVERNFYFDTSKPAVDEKSVGTSGLTTNAGTITLTGVVYDTNALYQNGAAGTVKITGTWNGQNRTVNATVTPEEKTVDGKSYTREQYATWTYTFNTANKEGVDDTAENYLPDNTYNFAIIATDTAGKTNQISRTVTVDTVAPKFGTKDSSENDSTNVKPHVATKAGSDSWYKTNSLRFEGTATDVIDGVTGTGIKEVYFETANSTDGGTTWSDWTGKTSFAGTTSWAGTIDKVESNTQKFRVFVEDNAGNKSEPVEFGPFKIDMTEPTLASGSVRVNTAEVSEENPFYSRGAKVNEGETVTNPNVTFRVADEENGSGIDKVYVKLYGKVTDTIAADVIQASVAADGSYTAIISADKIIKSGTVYARIYDNAGNYNDVNLFTLTYDATDPKIQSYTLSDNTSGYTAYNSGKDESGNAVYYVNNSAGHTFTLSGIATDNLGLASAVLSIGSVTKEITDENSLSSYSFTEIDLTSLSGETTAKITLTDKAGNTAGQEFTVKLDTASPNGVHETDSAGKDYIFRLGSGSDGKYSAGTYGNASTIQIRGYFEETGSGTNMIYYKLLGSAPKADDATSFLSDYANSANGYFAPLSSEETAEVSSSADSTTKTVKTNFKSNIAGFQEGKNYLLLVAVDNVGNAGLDNKTFEYTDENSQSVTVAGCYSINVDTTLPSVESDVSSTILTNGDGDITISGTAADSDAGIDSVTVKITVGTATYSSSDTDSKITVTTKTASGDTDNNLHWTATISKDAFSSVSYGNFTVYATAKDKAGEGNSQTVSVANISVDKVAPTVTLTKPTTADSSKTDNTYINGTISLSGTIKDANPLPSTAILAIQYMKKADYSSSNDNTDTGWTTLTNDEKGGMENLAISGDYTFDIKNFDTTKIEPLNGVAYYIRAKATDQAGNIGYSSNVEVKVSQDTDRPVIKFTNLTDLGESASPRFVLKYGTKSQVIATVTDDDGIESENDVVISGEKYTGSGSIKGLSSYSKTNGTVTFTPADDNTAGKNVDGVKTFYVYVKDAAGKVFYTTYKTDNSASNYLNVPKIKINDKALTDEADSAVFTYQSDSTSPTVEYIQALAYKSDGTTMNGALNAGTNEYSEYENVSASYVLGGSEKQKAKFFVTASDASGIAGMALEIAYTELDGSTETAKTLLLRSKDDSAIADGNYTVSGTFTQDSNDATKASWATDIIDFSKVKTGSVTVKVIPYDKLGLVGNGNATFAVDNSGPTISITSPVSGDECTGDITMTGTAIDSGSAGTSNIQWLVPTKTERATVSLKSTAADKLAYLKGLNWNGGDSSLASGFTVSSWSFKFDGEYDITSSDSENYIFRFGNPKFEVYDSATFASNDDFGTSGVYMLPVYFMATDKLGNCTLYEDYVLKHNPDADKPKLSFVYPTASDYDSGKEYVTLGGTIRATGSAEIPSGTTTVKAIYIQVADENAKFTGDAAATESETDSYTDKNTYGLTIVSAYEALEDILGSSVTVSDDTDAKKYGFSSKSVMDAWWGIKANGTASWNITLNSDDKMNPAEDSNETNNITLRACGINAEGKFGAWTSGSDVIAIHIDDAAPVVTSAVNQYASTLTATNIVSSNKATASSASQSYVSDMYLRGQWYLVIDVLDESGISTFSVKKGSTYLTVGSDYFAAEINKASDSTSTYPNVVDDSTTKKGKKLFIPISQEDSTVKYTVSATDADGTSHTTSQEFSFNIDNTAPSLEELKGNSETLLSGTSVIANQNYVYNIAGKSTDEGSGFERVVFYFMRKNNTTGTITNEVLLDPMITTGTEDSKIKISDLTALTVSQGETGYTLYAKAITGIVTSNTFSGSFNDHIRAGGLIYLDGIYRRITSVSGGVAAFEPSLSATSPSIGNNTTAYFPIAQVVDNTGSENVTTDSTNPSTFKSGDDGDLMGESVTKSGKTWTWDASIHSDNMPDGPVSLVILAFDEAGNVNGVTYNIEISNNAPRLAKVFLATDLNDNNKFEDDEFESYSIIGKEGKEQETYELSFADFGSTYASTSSGTFTAKNKLAVVPEIVGGNGNLSLVAKKGATTTDAVTTANGTAISSIANRTATDTDATALDASGSSNYTITASKFAAAASGNKFYAYVLSNAVLAGKSDGTALEESDDGTGKAFSFTFWDSTEERTQGTDSQNTVLLVKDFTFDLVDGTAPKTVINPFYWKNLNSNSIYGSADTDADDAYTVTGVGDLAGHIELENDIKGLTSYGDDAKVSGKITFTGTAYDEHSLKSLSFSFGKDGNYPFQNVTMAEYDTETATWSNTASWKEKNAGSVKTVSADGYEITIVEEAGTDYGVYEDSVYFGQAGHKIYWTLSIDTEKLSTVVAADVSLTVLATDLSGNVTVTTVTAPDVSDDYIPASSTGTRTVTDGKTNVPTYQMDVVPYVTKVYTALAKQKSSNWSVYNRTSLGHYPVQSVVSNIDSSISLKTTTSEDVTLYGFNINDSTAKIVSGSNTFTVGNGIDNSTSGQLTFNVANLASGKLELTVGGIPIMNNVNGNNAKGAASGTGTAYANCYNRQPNGDTNNILTDDIEFDVWEFNDRAALPINGTATGINMEINQKTGMLNYAFANGGVYYSMGGNIDKTTAYSADNSYSSYYWAGDYDTFAGPCVGFHVDDLGYTYSVDSGGDTNTSGSVDKWVLYSSRWGTLGRDYYGTLNGTNSLRLEEIALKLGKNNLNYSLMKYRFLSPEFASTVSGSSTNLYLVYYDALCNQIRFRAGTFNTTAKQTSGGFQDEYTGGASSYYSTNNCQIIANGSDGGVFIQDDSGATKTVSSIEGRCAGQYVDVAVVKNGAKDVVCIVWYDSDANCLKFSYIEDPISSWSNLAGDETALNWSNPVTIFEEGGEYCHIVSDKNNHLHIAAYAGNGDVMYAYLDSYDATAQPCTVDASGSVGEHLTLDVAVNSNGNSIPYIGYYTSAIKKPKYAYLVDNGTFFEQAPKGVDDNERFTGAWECAVVPSPSKMTTNREDKVNIGLWKNKGILTNSTVGTSQSHNSGSGYTSVNWSKTFGNGSSNGILGYQVSTSSGTGLETAQMR